MKKIIFFCGVLLLAGCGCGDCRTAVDQETYIKVFESCVQTPNGDVRACQNVAREAATTRVCKKQ